MIDSRRLLQRCWTICWQTVGDIVFPWICPLCDGPAEGSPFCDDCRDELLGAAGSTCDRCAMPVGPFANREGGCSECRGRALGFDAAVALGPYQGPIRDLCLRLKHEPNAWLAPWLAGVLAEARADALRGLPADSWVVPVPLHRWREWSRGYNQADELARGLAKRLALRKVHALRRVVATPALASLGRTERVRVMRHAFRARPRVDLTGRTIVLVDDILTSGATCGAAARALKKAGAARVVVAVIGRAEGNA